MKLRLPSKTEHEIQKDLQILMKGRTSIIIAHRLSTILSADKIVVLEKGKIVQVGKHKELINKRGVYSELWNLQKAAPLTPMTAVIGKNGVGKSTLFDAFGFLADSLKSGVEEACDTRGRGGFDRIRTQGLKWTPESRQY